MKIVPNVELPETEKLSFTVTVVLSTELIVAVFKEPIFAVFDTVKSFVTVKLFPIVTLFGKPIVKVSVALTTASISFEVPKYLFLLPHF
jgi:hypothetical protein